VQKDLLMTYVSALFVRAELGNVSRSTTERKKMSTKTSFKRVALVAVAALGMGVLTSVSPANAASGDLDGKVICTSSSTALNAATVVATTATTAANPSTITVVAGSTIKCTVSEATDYAAVDGAAFTSADFATTAAGADWDATTATGSATSTDPTTAAAVYSDAAPVVDGTYYLKITSAAGAGSAYVKVTVLDLAVLTADGFSATSGTATAASAYSSAVNGVAGPANTVTLKGLSNASGGKAGLVTVSGAGATITSGGTVATNGLTTSLPAGTLAQTSIVVATPTVGTVTASYYEESTAGSGIFSATAANTVTITVNATAQTNVYSAAKSTAYVNTGDNAGDATSDATYAAGLTAAATLSTTVERGTITVTQNDASGNALTSGFKAVSATITGGGLLGTASDTPTGAAVSSSAAATTSIKIFSNGTAGSATVTVSVDGVAVKTLKVTFYGAVASLTATVKKAYLQASTNTIADVIFVDAKDAQGNLVVNTPTITSATTGVALTGACAASDPTTTPATPAKCTVTTGATTGSALLTITASTVTTVTTTATVNVSKSVATTIVLATDKATYGPGEKATLSLTLKDSNGAPVASGDYTTALVAGGLTPSSALTSTLKFNSTDTTITVLDGKATVDFYVPITAGPVTISGTYGTGAVVGTLASTALTTKFTVSESTSVQSLTLLINSLIKKINALSTLVAKIQKKLGVK